MLSQGHAHHKETKSIQVVNTWLSKVPVGMQRLKGEMPPDLQEQRTRGGSQSGWCWEISAQQETGVANSPCATMPY